MDQSGFISEQADWISDNNNIEVSVCFSFFLKFLNIVWLTKNSSHSND